MGKKVLNIALIIILGMALTMIASAANEKKPAAAPALAASGVKQPPMAQGRMMPKSMVPSLGIVSGTIAKIDNNDPANAKVDIKSDKDNSLHTFVVMPWTNVTKITDLSELKTGEPVRIISRKINDKDTAMGIIFGNLKSMTAPGPGPTAPVPPAKKPTATVVPENTKK